jgi:hypothetical protein
MPRLDAQVVPESSEMKKSGVTGVSKRHGLPFGAVADGVKPKEGGGMLSRVTKSCRALQDGSCE